MRTYDLQKMQELLHDFYNLTGIKICIYDDAENELCYYPEKLSPFCNLVRSDARAEKRCLDCDRRAFAECKKTRRRAVTACHAGLLECFSPILYEEKIIGYIAIGQIRTQQANVMPDFRDFPEEMRADLRALYANLPVIGMDKIHSAIHILDACAGYEYLRALIKDYGGRLESRLCEYIEKNLMQDLSVTALCRTFRLSRNEIYSLFRDRFDATVADFVKERRLCRARELLEKTAQPVAKIAVLCGIPDYNYFTKQFRRAFGVSPSKWRKQNAAPPAREPMQS